MLLITGALLLLAAVASVVVAVAGPPEVVLAAIIVAAVFLPVGATMAYIDWPSRDGRPSGQRARATVLDVRRAGGDHMAQPVIELRLEVRPKGDAPFEVTMKAIPPRHRRLEPGRTLSVYVDPVDRRRVEIDWASR